MFQKDATNDRHMVINGRQTDETKLFSRRQQGWAMSKMLRPEDEKQLTRTRNHHADNLRNLRELQRSTRAAKETDQLLSSRKGNFKMKRFEYTLILTLI